jgi:hypothetical protein
MIDKQKVIRNYIANVQEMHRLPFITDDEMQQLFGEDITTILTRLSLYDTEKGLCVNCVKRCCLVVHCELYDARFPGCPIFKLRPVVCRLHYCHLFQKDCGQLVEELSDIFFECVIAAESSGITPTRLFDSPPLVRCAPEFISRIGNIMQSVRNNGVDLQHALAVINIEAEKHRVLPD